MRRILLTISLLLAPFAGAQTITYTGANCTGNASSAAASCTLNASGAVGDLLVIVSKSSSATNSVTAALTFSATSSCSSPTQVVAPTWQSNGGAHFSATMFACVITTAGANVPVVTWTGVDGTFTDIAVATYHTTTSWKSTFTDQTATNIAATSTASCPTGTTSTTNNATDLVLALCTNFNAGQTWGTLSGYTNRANSSRNTTGWYDTSVTVTGAQSATVPLSASDYGLGMIVAFASNSGGAASLGRGQAVIF